MSEVPVTTEQVHELIQQLAAMNVAASITPQIVANIFENMRQLNDQEREKVIATAEAYIAQIENYNINANKVDYGNKTVKEELNEINGKIGIEDAQVSATIPKFQYVPVLYKRLDEITALTINSNDYIAFYDSEKNKVNVIDGHNQTVNQINGNNVNNGNCPPPYVLQGEVAYIKAGGTSGDSVIYTVFLKGVDGLTQAISRLNNAKVDKVPGKFLSSNDYTDSDKENVEAMFGDYRRATHEFLPMQPFRYVEIDIRAGSLITEMTIADNGALSFYDSNQTRLTFYDSAGNEITGIAGTNYNRGQYTFPVIIDQDISYIRLGGEPVNNNIVIVEVSGEKGDFQDVKDYVDKLKAFTTRCDTDPSQWMKYIYNTPMATWIDDDGVYNGIEKIKPIFEDLSIPITFAVIPPMTNTAYGNTTRRDYFSELQRKGHHVTTHPVHQWWYGNNYDIKKAEESLIDCLTELQADGFLHSDMLVYPGGSSGTQAIVNIVRKWCQCGITAGFNEANHLGENSKWLIKRCFIQFDSTRTVTWYKGVIDRCYANGDWLVFGTHSNDFINSEDTSDETAMTTGNLKLVIQYALGKMSFYTLWDAYNRRKPIFEAKDLERQ